MIRVQLQPEPSDFDEAVRQPGLSAIAELVGEEALITRPGRKREQLVDAQNNPITDRTRIPGSKFPDYWTKALDSLWEAYDQVCAFTCLYIPRVTGNRSVDHMIPKSRAWDRVYEWSNYRLACGLANSRKGASEEVLDPFEIEDGWFHLELTGFQVLPNPVLDDDTKARVNETIRILGLNERDCLKQREDYALGYWEHDLSLRRLERRAPHIAIELRRQRRLNPSDMPQQESEPS